MVNKYFLSGAECNFFRVLRHVVEPRGYVLAQVALNRLLYLPGSSKTNPGRGKWWGHIAQKSVDFVVCDAATLRPILAIELDDSSHAQARRESRDEVVEQACRAAGLELHRVTCSHTYDTRELRDLILPYLGGLAPKP